LKHDNQTNFKYGIGGGVVLKTNSFSAQQSAFVQSTLRNFANSHRPQKISSSIVSQTQAARLSQPSQVGQTPPATLAKINSLLTSDGWTQAQQLQRIEAALETQMPLKPLIKKEQIQLTFTKIALLLIIQI